MWTSPPTRQLSSPATGSASKEPTVTVNLKAREVYKLTFTFAECGIDDGTAHKALAGEDAGKPAWNFEVIVIPRETTGALKGSYEYRLKADLI